MTDEDRPDSLSQPINPASDPNWDTYTAAQQRLAALENARKTRQAALTPAARRQAAQRAQRIAQLQRVIAARRKATQYQAEQSVIDTSTSPPLQRFEAVSSTDQDTFAQGLIDDVTDVEQLETLLRELHQQDPALYDSLEQSHDLSLSNLNDGDMEAIMRGYGDTPDDDTTDNAQPHSFDSLRGNPRPAAPAPNVARDANWRRVPQERANEIVSKGTGAQPSYADLTNRSNSGRLLSLLLGGGLTMVVFILAGYYLDQALKTAPTFTLIGVGVAVFTLFTLFVAFYRLATHPHK